MVGEPSHMKQLSLNHVCKIGLTYLTAFQMCISCQDSKPGRTDVSTEAAVLAECKINFAKTDCKSLCADLQFRE
jgi:hypothetical protein